RDWLQGKELEEHLYYWKQQLNGAPPVLDLPTDRPRPAIQSFRGRRHDLGLSADLAGALKALSQREGVTMFMTLLAAFSALLHRYSRQNDVVVGVPIANRNVVEVEGLIGFFANTVALRTRPAGDRSFRELLREVRDIAVQAQSHREVPFDLIVQALQ